MSIEKARDALLRAFPVDRQLYALVDFIDAKVNAILDAREVARSEIARASAGGGEASCYDCGLPYTDPGFCDLVVANDVWLAIGPTGKEGGLLCPTCMCRAATRAGLEKVTATFRSGPFTPAQPAPAAEGGEADDLAGRLLWWRTQMLTARVLPPHGPQDARPFPEILEASASALRSATARIRELKGERDEARGILAGTDYPSLPNDWTLAQVAEARMADIHKYMRQVRDTCVCAEAAEASAARLRKAVEGAIDNIRQIEADVLEDVDGDAIIHLRDARGALTAALQPIPAAMESDAGEKYDSDADEFVDPNGSRTHAKSFAEFRAEHRGEEIAARGGEDEMMKDEFAWVIERGDSPTSGPIYWTGQDEGWSGDHMDAIRFARKIDAERVMYHFRRPNCRACEHGWLTKADPTPVPAPEPEEDHERIWLQNAADGKEQNTGRLWCQDKVWPDDALDGKPTEYVRADILRSAHQTIADLTRERDEARALSTKLRRERDDYLREWEAAEAELVALREMIKECQRLMSRARDNIHNMIAAGDLGKEDSAFAYKANAFIAQAFDALLTGAGDSGSDVAGPASHHVTEAKDGG